MFRWAPRCRGSQNRFGLATRKLLSDKPWSVPYCPLVCPLLSSSSMRIFNIISMPHQFSLIIIELLFHSFQYSRAKILFVIIAYES